MGWNESGRDEQAIEPGQWTLKRQRLDGDMEQLSMAEEETRQKRTRWGPWSTKAKDQWQKKFVESGGYKQARAKIESLESTWKRAKNVDRIYKA